MSISLLCIYFQKHIIYTHGYIFIQKNSNSLVFAEIVFLNNVYWLLPSEEFLIKNWVFFLFFYLL